LVIVTEALYSDEARRIVVRPQVLQAMQCT